MGIKRPDVVAAAADEKIDVVSLSLFSSLISQFDGWSFHSFRPLLSRENHMRVCVCLCAFFLH